VGGVELPPAAETQIGGTTSARVIDKSEDVRLRSTGREIERALQLIIQNPAPAVLEGDSAKDVASSERYIVEQINVYDATTQLRVTRFRVRN